MSVHEHLHHQHRRGNQKHIGNRAQGGVKILDAIIHPAAEIARHDAHGQSERQHHQRGQRADYQCGAYALERKIKHVLSHFIGAEHMVMSAENRHGKHEQYQYAQRDQYRKPWNFTFAAPQGPGSFAKNAPSALCHQPHQSGSDNQPCKCSQEQGVKHTPGDVFRPLFSRIAQIRRAVFQARVIPDFPAIRQLDGLLGK